MDIVATIVSLFNLAVKAAPAVKTVYTDFRNLVNQLVEKGAISVQDQANLMTWSDAHMFATLTGQMPPEFAVINDTPPLLAVAPAPKPGVVDTGMAKDAPEAVPGSNTGGLAGGFGGSVSVLHGGS